MTTYDLIFQEVKGKLSDQMKSVEIIATKFNFLLAFNAIIITGLIQAVSQRPELFGSLMKWSFFAIIASIFSIFIGFELRQFRKDPDPKKLVDYYYDKGVEKIKSDLIGNYAESYEENAKTIKYLRYVYDFSAALSIMAVTLIAIYFLKGINYVK